MKSTNKPKKKKSIGCIKKFEEKNKKKGEQLFIIFTLLVFRIIVQNIKYKKTET